MKDSLALTYRVWSISTPFAASKFLRSRVLIVEVLFASSGALDAVSFAVTSTSFGKQFIKFTDNPLCRLPTRHSSTI